jgi:hypothetical protein
MLQVRLCETEQLLKLATDILVELVLDELRSWVNGELSGHFGRSRPILSLVVVIYLYAEFPKSSAFLRLSSDCPHYRARADFGALAKGEGIFGYRRPLRSASG